MADISNHMTDVTWPAAFVRFGKLVIKVVLIISHSNTCEWHSYPRGHSSSHLSLPYPCHPDGVMPTVNLISVMSGTKIVTFVCAVCGFFFPCHLWSTLDCGSDRITSWKYQVIKGCSFGLVCPCRHRVFRLKFCLIGAANTLFVRLWSSASIQSHWRGHITIDSPFVRFLWFPAKWLFHDFLCENVGHYFNFIHTCDVWLKFVKFPYFVLPQCNL